MTQHHALGRTTTWSVGWSSTAVFITVFLSGWFHGKWTEWRTKKCFYIPNVLFAHEVINLTGCFIWVWTSLWNTDDLLVEYHVMCEFQKQIWETTTLIAVPGHAPCISHEFENMMLRKWNAMLHLLSVLVMVVPHFGPNWGNEITHAKLQQARAIRFHCRMHQGWAVDNF